MDRESTGHGLIRSDSSSRDECIGNAEPVVSLSHVSKDFRGNRVLRDVDFDLYKSEVHALVGSNGSGKSTLLKMVYGVHQPTSGMMKVRGETVKFRTPAHAMKYGIAAVPQELPLVPSLTVAENIFFGNLPRKHGAISWSNLFDFASKALERVDPSGTINPRDLVAHLDLAGQQLVSIARALTQGAKILVLDEPTSSLDAKAVENLFRLIKVLTSEGKSIAFISQRLDDIFAIADRVSVLRDGEMVGKSPINNLTVDELVKLMAGNIPTKEEFGSLVKTDKARLEVEGLQVGDHLRGLDFSLYQGEILGIVGLPGSGVEKVLPAIFGKVSLSSGTIRVDSKCSTSESIRHRIRSRIAYVSGDRIKDGLVRNQSVEFNLLLIKNNHLGFAPISSSRQYPEVCDVIKELKIRPPNPKAIVGTLSGGNQQKILVGRWLLSGAEIWLLDDPTRGVDAHSRYEIHNIIRRRVALGGAAIMTSSDLQEMVEMCHRLLIVYKGEKIAEVSQSQANEHIVLALASGAAAPWDTDVSKRGD